MLRGSFARRPVALLLAAVLAAGGAVAPVLHAEAPDGRAHVEASHDPSRCHVGHDHLVCRLLGGGAPTPHPLPDIQLGPDRGDVAVARRTSDAPTTPSRTLPEPRGPPAAG